MLTEEEKNAGLVGRIIPINIEEQMKTAYIDYSMSVIVSRALPDVRDGLKPVHRRILYDMSAELNLSSDKPTRKSARIVGDVLGKFHPHGDSSVYDAMVRLAQEWSMRYPLVDGQGNFGSMDGDSPAAMRYTEARMKKITDEVMADIEKETIDWTLNFDDTIPEPTVLPTKIPLLLVNGASGIAVGMATNMAPHNLCEVVDACCAYIDNPEIECEELLQYVKGPDFPTGGLIYGYDGVREALLTGRGRVMMRARTEIEHTASGRECIVITEIPYMVNKAEMIKKIADLINDKKIEGISYINDESDRNGLRIIIILKQDAVASVVLNTLYKNTPLQTSFAVNNIALVKGRPMLLNLRELIRHFVEHRHDVVVRRTRFDLRKAEERLHIVQGLLIAQDNIDEIVHIIRSSQTPDAAKERMMERFGLSDLQSAAIIDMRLRALTGLERGKLDAEREELEKRIAYFREVLASRDEQMRVIREELIEMKEKYGDERRTEIIYASEEFNPEDFYADEDMVITMSHMGYIKRTPLAEYRTQHRGGVGVKGSATRDEDFIEHIYVASMHADDVLHREGPLLLAQGVRHSGGHALVEGSRDTEPDPDRTRRQGPRLHQLQAPERPRVRERQLHHHVHEGRHDQEDEARSLLASAPERRERHRHPRGRPADRRLPHERLGRGDDRRTRRQSHPLQREHGASDRPCGCGRARHFDRGERRGDRHDLRGARLEAGCAGAERKRLRQAHRSGRIPHHQPRRQGREDDQRYGEDRTPGVDPGRVGRKRPDDHQPLGPHDPHGGVADPRGGPCDAGRAHHQPARGRRHRLGDGRAQIRGGGAADRRRGGCRCGRDDGRSRRRRQCARRGTVKRRKHTENLKFLSL